MYKEYTFNGDFHPRMRKNIPWQVFIHFYLIRDGFDPSAPHDIDAKGDRVRVTQHDRFKRPVKTGFSVFDWAIQYQGMSLRVLEMKYASNVH